MNWNALNSIDWEGLETTEDWAKILNDLRGLIDSADSKDKRTKLAAKLDEFADHSVSDDLVTITKLDTSARRAARALRSSNVSERIQELSAASKEYQAAVKEFSAATAGLKKEASLLRAEKVTEAVKALTETISSLKTLSQVVGDGDDAKVGDAISDAVNAAKKLRDILEQPA